MQMRSKLVFFELAGGLFGWLWIIASVAGIYFLVAALAANGRWSNLLWAVGISVVAKWLARGFSDHQKRVAYEAELVLRGLTPEEARAAWFEAYTHGTASLVTLSPISPTSSEVVLVEAQDLVNKYGAVLEHSKTLIRSEAALPASKEQIKNALVALARHAKISGFSPEALEALRVGYASLADFVSERDAEAVNKFDNLTGAAATRLDDARLRELAAQVAESGAGAVEVTSHSTDEFARLTAEFDERVHG